ncbi:MAG: hypothetical protein AAB433_23320, partial [Nitrospirota bacterium]
PTGPGRDAIAKSVMVYTAVPPDYCDNDVRVSYSKPHLASTFLQAKTSSIIPRRTIDLRFQGIDIYQVRTG